MELIAARRYFFCRHCGSFHFPEAVDESIRVIERDPGDWVTWYALAAASSGADARYAINRAAQLNPRSPDVAEFRAEHGREVEYHRWVQYELDRQLAAAALVLAAGAFSLAGLK